MPLDRMVLNECNDELVQVTGTLHVTEQTTQSSTGMIRVTTYENFQETSGVGPTPTRCTTSTKRCT